MGSSGQGTSPQSRSPPFQVVTTLPVGQSFPGHFGPYVGSAQGSGGLEPEPEVEEQVQSVLAHPRTGWEANATGNSSAMAPQQPVTPTRTPPGIHVSPVGSPGGGSSSHRSSSPSKTINYRKTTIRQEDHEHEIEPASPEVTRQRPPGDRAHQTTVLRSDGAYVPVIVTPLHELGLDEDEVDEQRRRQAEESRLGDGSPVIVPGTPVRSAVAPAGTAITDPLIDPAGRDPWAHVNIDKADGHQGVVGAPSALAYLDDPRLLPQHYIQRLRDACWPPKWKELLPKCGILLLVVVFVVLLLIAALPSPKTPCTSPLQPTEPEPEPEHYHVCDTNPCGHHGACQPPAGYMCKCEHGWDDGAGGHRNCTHATGCESNPCQHGGKCAPSADGYDHLCHCTHGWEGPDCQNGTGCDGNRCKSVDHNATCTASGALYTCHCSDSYFGPECTELKGCTPNPCQHCGVCVPEPAGKFKCYCPNNAGWSGPTCASSTACDNVVCKHNGTCQVPAHSTGCASNPCENGACEEQMPDGHICHCRAGWEGADCDRPNATAVAPPCVDPPKLQGTCTCPPGWSGDRCDVAEACQNHPCEHNGKCVPASNGLSYQCNCSGTGWNGPNCELNGCRPDPCNNGGHCLSVPGSDTQHTCDCSFATPAGKWAGLNCEYVACDLICADKCPADADPVTGRYNCTHDAPLSNHTNVANNSTRHWPWLPPQQPATWDTVHEVLPDVDLGPLGTYHRPPGVGGHWTYEDCQKLCTQNYPQCKAWVFRVNNNAGVRPDDARTCSLKDGVRAIPCPHLSC